MAIGKHTAKEFRGYITEERLDKWLETAANGGAELPMEKWPATREMAVRKYGVTIYRQFSVEIYEFSSEESAAAYQIECYYREHVPVVPQFICTRHFRDQYSAGTPNQHFYLVEGSLLDLEFEAEREPEEVYLDYAALIEDCELALDDAEECENALTYIKDIIEDDELEDALDHIDNAKNSLIRFMDKLEQLSKNGV